MASTRFYTTEKLGEKQSMTPEGFLLCESVPLARVGTQLYAEHELPGMKGRDGIISISRDEDEVFDPRAVLSFAGKPVTNDHPPVKVTPQNIKHYFVGTVLNPRRGDGRATDANFLYGDLLITDPEAIDDIRSRRKREVSAGYDAEYEQTQDGEGRQRNIIGNHVALVKKGRCGPLCTIGDKAMATPRRRLNRSALMRDRIIDAVRTGNLDAAVEELDKVDELMGEQVSGRDEGLDPRGLTINVNHHGSGGSASGSTGDDENDPPAEGGGNAAEAQILARLDRIEQAIVALAQGDDGDDDDDGDGYDDRYGGDRRGVRDRRGTRDRRVRDDAAEAPPSDEPDLKPDNRIPYGGGTGAARYRQETAGGTHDRRGTRDRRVRDEDRDDDDREDDRRERTNDRRSTRDHLAPSEQGQRQHFVGDSTSMRNEFIDTVARAEMLVPGFKAPTFDAATPAKTTFDALCSMRRNALDQAYHSQDHRKFVDGVLGGRPGDFGKMTCDAIGVVFTAASELARHHNNQTIGRARTGVARTGSTALTPAEINQRNREKYGVKA